MSKPTKRELQLRLQAIENEKAYLEAKSKPPQDRVPQTPKKRNSEAASGSSGSNASTERQAMTNAKIPKARPLTPEEEAVPIESLTWRHGTLVLEPER